MKTRLVERGQGYWYRYKLKGFLVDSSSTQYKFPSRFLPV